MVKVVEERETDEGAEYNLEVSTKSTSVSQIAIASVGRMTVFCERYTH